MVLVLGQSRNICTKGVLCVEPDQTALSSILLYEIQ